MKGHIRERSPGHWAIVIDSRDANGKRKRRWHSFRGTKRQAQVECARLISEMRGGGAVDPSRITVGQFLDRFERDWIVVHTSARSAERYRDALVHVRRELGERPLQKLRPADLAALYATLSRSGMAPNGVRMVHRVLHRALGQAKTWGVVRDNVTEVIKPPPAPDQEREILQPDRARELLEKLRGHPLYMLASLALATGARRNELLALRWQDVDLDAGRLRIETALEQTRGHGVRVKAPKTRKGRRTISLPAHTVANLRAHWRAQQEQRLALGIGKSPADSPVLATFDGRLPSPEAITKAWSRAIAAIGMPDAGLHSLRHTHVSMLLASGMDILTISRRIGHASVKVTLDTYGHLIHGTDDRAAQIMDAAFGNGSSPVADNGKKPEISRQGEQSPRTAASPSR
jgi:integrase